MLLLTWRHRTRAGYREAGDSITEMYSNSRSEAFGEEVQRRILLGTFTLSRRFVPPLPLVNSPVGWMVC
jgi:Asp-tRNA(Asn)/Glu-tRNA(Gln) amidotransferase A subunit family amidase